MTENRKRTRRMEDDFKSLLELKFKHLSEQIEDVKSTIGKKFDSYDNVCRRVDSHDTRINLLYGFVFGGFGLSAIVVIILKVFEVI